MHLDSCYALGDEIGRMFHLRHKVGFFASVERTRLVLSSWLCLPMGDWCDDRDVRRVGTSGPGETLAPVECICKLRNACRLSWPNVREGRKKGRLVGCGEAPCECGSRQEYFERG